jgi:hypothetical protein
MNIIKKIIFPMIIACIGLAWVLNGCGTKPVVWELKTQQDWLAASAECVNIEITDGCLKLTSDSAFFATALKKFKNKHQLKSMTIQQSPVWNNWHPIDKVAPSEAQDAPVFVPVSHGNYWFLSRYKGDDTNGYHSWHSTDMKKWSHYGPITTAVNRWVTSAEYVDGKFYIYFDKPNDEDPHLIIDDDLTDGKQGEEIGMVFNDPSHGSDMAIFRDEDGTFHLIYEDWSPLDAGKHAWDSPLAGHADSPDGMTGFEPHEFPAPIDERSIPTGIMVNYTPHSNQLIPGKDLSPYNYEIHEGPQDAYGDYAMIKVGRQYYLFCDYHSHEKSKTMRIGRWRTHDITKPFIWDGEIGEKIHPDPTIGFAEGKFYLIVQGKKNDFVSDGPWVDGVEARVGVDVDNDGNMDEWTEFQKVKEIYSQKEGFLRVIESKPATLDVTQLPSGYAFKVELRLVISNDSWPLINCLEAEFM